VRAIRSAAEPFHWFWGFLLFLFWIPLSMNFGSMGWWCSYVLDVPLALYGIRYLLQPPHRLPLRWMFLFLAGMAVAAFLPVTDADSLGYVLPAAHLGAKGGLSAWVDSGNYRALARLWGESAQLGWGLQHGLTGVYLKTFGVMTWILWIHILYLWGRLLGFIIRSTIISLLIGTAWISLLSLGSYKDDLLFAAVTLGCLATLPRLRHTALWQGILLMWGLAVSKVLYPASLAAVLLHARHRRLLLLGGVLVGLAALLVVHGEREYSHGIRYFDGKPKAVAAVLLGASPTELGAHPLTPLGGERVRLQEPSTMARPTSFLRAFWTLPLLQWRGADNYLYATFGFLTYLIPLGAAACLYSCRRARNLHLAGGLFLAFLLLGLSLPLAASSYRYFLAPFALLILMGLRELYRWGWHRVWDLCAGACAASTLLLLPLHLHKPLFQPTVHAVAAPGPGQLSPTYVRFSPQSTCTEAFPDVLALHYTLLEEKPDVVMLSGSWQVHAPFTPDPALVKVLAFDHYYPVEGPDAGIAYFLPKESYLLPFFRQGPGGGVTVPQPGTHRTRSKTGK
jgi:hypothetical protein